MLKKLPRIRIRFYFANLIAQANARYILYNTEESKENFPRYTIKDEQLNILAFKYLNIGCNYFSEHNYLKASHSLEKEL